MHQLCGEWQAAYSRECAGKLQIPQTLRNQLFVPGYAGKYFPAFYFCTGTVLLAPSFRTSAHGTCCMLEFPLKLSSGQAGQTANLP